MLNYILNFKTHYKNFSSFFQNIFRSQFAKNMYLSQLNVVSQTHKNSFESYKNIYNSKEIAIIATGPTLNKYKPISNTVNIALNSAIKKENIKFDYFFVQDYNGLKKCINEAENLSNVVKFYGIVPPHPYGLKESNLLPVVIPESVISRHNANKYYIYVKYPKNPVPFNTEIDKTWLADGGSVAFSAIQFALFTNPKKIYLVGCDCSNGYFDNNISKINLNNTYLKSWYELKEFADIYYPETEIISVNPVGLKGLFKDLYQEGEY